MTGSEKREAEFRRLERERPQDCGAVFVPDLGWVSVLCPVDVPGYRPYVHEVRAVAGHFAWSGSLNEVGDSDD